MAARARSWLVTAGHCIEALQRLILQVASSAVHESPLPASPVAVVHEFVVYFLFATSAKQLEPKVAFYIFSVLCIKAHISVRDQVGIWTTGHEREKHDMSARLRTT